MSYNERSISSGKSIGVAVMVIAILVVLVIAVMFAFPAFWRYQSRTSAENEVTLNEIKIQQQAQLITVEQKRAEIRVEEAKGIASAQEIINSSLTDRYLQHEAIKAQERMAGSPSHTQIYMPIGPGGIPLVHSVGAGK